MEFNDAVIEFIYPVAKNYIGKFIEKRKKITREILLSEIRDGIISNVDEDDLLSIAYRVSIDVMEGIAKNNLRLLARMICGLNNCQKLTTSNFKKYERILVDLTEDEIFILSKIISNYLDKSDTLMCSCVDKALVDICGTPEKCDKNKFNRCMEQLSALERTGLVVKTGKTSETFRTGHPYHSPYHITALMKEIIQFFPNWLDIATDNTYQ